MTLGEISRVVLQKSYTNEEKFEDEIVDIISDDEYSLHCQNIIPALNEVIQKLDKYQQKTESILINKAWIEENNNNSSIINMKTKFTDFKSLEFKGVYLNNKQFTNYEVRSNRYIILPMLTQNEEYTIFYRKKPKFFNIDNIENELDIEINLDDELIVLIPFYIASQILKDENISLATIYRNEFEAGLDDIELSNQITPEIQDSFGMRW